MAKEICQECGCVFEPKSKKGMICPACHRKILSRCAKERNLNKLGNEAYSKQQAERKRMAHLLHGCWIELAFGELKCSACGIIQEDNAFPYNYCPNCGAKMDGDGNG